VGWFNQTVGLAGNCAADIALHGVWKTYISVALAKAT
jgi:hypothetical protein